MDSEFNEVGLETPPSKLRSRIAHVEQELKEIAEFTRLEKQLYNEELTTELEKVKLQLKEALSKCETLEEVKNQFESMKQTDRTAHGYRIMLMDSSKAIATLQANAKLEEQLSELSVKCQNFEEVKRQLTDAEEHLSLIRKEKADLVHSLKLEINSLRSSNDSLVIHRDSLIKQLDEKDSKLAELGVEVKKHEEKIFHLNNEKEDFVLQLEMRISNYEMRFQEMARALGACSETKTNLENLADLVHSLKLEINSLRSSNDSLVIHRDSLIKQLDEKDSKLAELGVEVKKHEEKIFHLNNEKEDFVLQLEMRISNYEMRFQEMARALGACSETKTNLENLADLVHSLKLEINSLRSSNDSLVIHKDSLIKQLDEKDSKLAELAVEVKKHEEKIFHLNNEKEDYVLQLEMRISNYEMRFQEMARALGACSETKTNLENLADLVHSLKLEINSLRSSNYSLTRELADSNFAELGVKALGTLNAANPDKLQEADEKFKCSLCPSLYAYERGLKRHMRMKHPEEQLSTTTTTSSSSTSPGPLLSSPVGVAITVTVTTPNLNVGATAVTKPLLQVEVQCPSCKKYMPESQINAHLDACLKS